MPETIVSAQEMGVGSRGLWAMPEHGCDYGSGGQGSGFVGLPRHEARKNRA